MFFDLKKNAAHFYAAFVMPETTLPNQVNALNVMMV